MSNKSLEHAIKLAKTGNHAKAQELLKALIASDHHNLPAWFWLVETCSTNKQRVDVLTICLEYNPDNEQAKQLLEKLQTLPTQPLMQSVSYQKTDNASSISKEGNLFSHLLIICLSIISGLLIASPYFVFLELNLLFAYKWGVTIPWVLLLLFIVVELLLPAPQKIHSGFIILSRLFSVVSVIILVVMIFLYYLPSRGELGLGILLVLVALQGLGIIVPWFLITPVTFSVQKIASLFLTQTSLDSMDPIFRTGIPWIFNVLGASALIILSLGNVPKPSLVEAPAEVNLTGEYSDKLGTFYGEKSLDVLVGVSPTKAGKFDVSAELVSGDQIISTRTSYETMLVPGSNTVIIQFPGEDIRHYRLDGPYQVKVFMIYDWQTADYIEVNDTWQTAAYHWRDFGGEICFPLFAKVMPNSSAASMEITPPPNCPYNQSYYLSATYVTLKVTANPGFQFKGWGGVGGAGDSTLITIRMNNEKVANAFFEPKP